MKTKDIITEVIDLPIEERAMVVDSILKSLNPIQADIDKKWAEVAKRRLKALRSGEVKGIPGVDVFQRTWEKFSQRAEQDSTATRQLVSVGPHLMRLGGLSVFVGRHLMPPTMRPWRKRRHEDGAATNTR